MFHSAKHRIATSRHPACPGPPESAGRQPCPRSRRLPRGDRRIPACPCPCPRPYQCPPPRDLTQPRPPSVAPFSLRRTKPPPCSRGHHPLQHHDWDSHPLHHHHYLLSLQPSPLWHLRWLSNKLCSRHLSSSTSTQPLPTRRRCPATATRHSAARVRLISCRSSAEPGPARLTGPRSLPRRSSPWPSRYHSLQTGSAYPTSAVVSSCHRRHSCCRHSHCRRRRRRRRNHNKRCSRRRRARCLRRRP